MCLGESQEALGRYIALNGAQIYIEQMGMGDPLVLLHAGIADRRMWDPQFALLAQRFKVVRWDARGYGRSRIPNAPFSYARDLSALLETLDCGPATLMAASMGAAAAIRVALDRPQLVHRLVLIGASIYGFQGSTEPYPLYQEFEAAEERRDIEQAIALAEQIWLAGPDRPVSAIDPRLRQLFRAMNEEFYAQAEWGAELLDLHSSDVDRLREIALPTLVIVGEEDTQEIREAATVITRSIAGSTLRTVAGSAHLPSLERPEVVNQLLIEWLDGA